MNQPQRQAVRDLFYWGAAPQQALRWGDWKAYRAWPDKPVQVFHLTEDICKKRDLAAQQPEIAAKLERQTAESRVDSNEFSLERRKR